MEDAREPLEECAYCGGSFRVGRLACPHCGSDRQTGWQAPEELEAAAVDTEPDRLGPEEYDSFLRSEGLEDRSRPLEPQSRGGVVVWLILLAVALGLIYFLGR